MGDGDGGVVHVNRALKREGVAPCAMRFSPLTLQAREVMAMGSSGNDTDGCVPTS